MANNPWYLFCLDFKKAYPSKDSKENVLVITDAFSKFTVAVIIPYQKAQSVAKIVIDKWFFTKQIPSQIHSDNGWSFENDIIHHLCEMYGVQQMTTMPYSPQGNSFWERAKHIKLKVLKTSP